MYSKDIKAQPNADDEYWKESEFESNYQINQMLMRIFINMTLYNQMLMGILKA